MTHKTWPRQNTLAPNINSAETEKSHIKVSYTSYDLNIQIIKLIFYFVEFYDISLS